MKKRVFSAEFKSKLVIEVLRGEKELNMLAIENEIAPNLLRNWKSEFLEKASAVFDNKKDDKIKEILNEKIEENDRLYKKVGQLTTEVDWLKKKSEELFGFDWESKFTARGKR